MTVNRRWRVLVFDEHDASRWIACFLLTLLGWECHAVRTEEQAVIAAEQFDPDAFMYEWNVGGTARSGLARRVRDARPRKQPALVVVATSTIDEPSAFRKAEAIDRYFCKRFGGAFTLIHSWSR